MFSFTTAFCPTDSIGIVVLVNKFDATISEMIRDYIADKLLSLPFKDWNNLILDMKRRNNNSIQSSPQKEITVFPLSHPLADYTGVYTHPAYGNIIVTMQHDFFIRYP